MQRRLLRFGAFLILMLFTWGHLSELFDQWDNTFETGNDIEYSVVFLALVAGAAIVVLALLFSCAVQRRKRFSLCH